MYTALGVHGVFRGHSQAEMCIKVNFITGCCMGYDSEVGIKLYSTEERAAVCFGLSINSE